MAYRVLNGHQMLKLSKEFKPTQNLLSITDHDFDNFGGKKVVIWTILALNQAKS